MEETNEDPDTDAPDKLDPLINRRVKPDVIQLKVGTSLSMLLGYEKMYNVGEGRQIKSRLIATQVEIIILDGGIRMLLSAAATVALVALEAL